MNKEQTIKSVPMSKGQIMRSVLLKNGDVEVADLALMNNYQVCIQFQRSYYLLSPVLIYSNEDSQDVIVIPKDKINPQDIYQMEV